MRKITGRFLQRFIACILVIALLPIGSLSAREYHPLYNGDTAQNQEYTIIPDSYMAGDSVYDYDQLDTSMDYYINSDEYVSNIFLEELSLLTYDGSNRIVNNLLYIYENGRLVSIVDAFGNRAELFYDQYDNLVEIHVGGEIVSVDVCNSGLISSFDLIGHSVSYEHEEGILVSIDRNNIIIDLVYDYDGDAVVFLNDSFIAEVSVSDCSELSVGRQRFYGGALNRNVMAFENDLGLIDTLQYGLGNVFLSSDFEHNQDNEISRIQFSNGVELIAEYDRHGFSNRLLLVEQEDGQVLELETIERPIFFENNNLVGLEEFIFSQNDNYLRHVINDMGFISSIYQNGVLLSQFTYDEMGQLISEVNNYSNFRSYITYDSFGNILSNTMITADGIVANVFEYANPNWNDQLTSFNGSPIRYDSMGNMLSGLGMNMSWNNGRLVSLQTDTDHVTFEYNSDGVRTSKTVNGITTNFLLDGYRILAEETEGQVIVYMFDNEERLLGFIFNDEEFFYLTNPFGDITGIMNSSMEVIVKYNYDAWGNIISITGPYAETIGRLNPFRFRGYRFDEVSGLYYLNARYYSPILGRFISPNSDVGIIGHAISHNLYAYALNNPVMYTQAVGTMVVGISLKGIAITLVSIMTLFYSVHFLQVTLVNDFNNAANSLIHIVESVGDAFSREVARVVRDTSAATNVQNRTTNHTHHIVPSAHRDAGTARAVYLQYWFDFNHHINIIMLREPFHRRIHTFEYIRTLNGILLFANGGSTLTNTRMNLVTAAMNGVRVVLSAANRFIP